MGYLVFRGVSTQTLAGVYVSKMPSHRKASMRYSEYYVKGRDGALHVDEGFANFNLSAVLVLVNAAPNARQLVNAWADGTGKLITSDQPGYAYRASVKDEIIWTRVPGNVIRGGLTFFDTAQITWSCQPYMYEAVEEELNITGPETTVYNPGTATAIPMIQVNGSGDVTFSINSQQVSLTGLTEGVPLYIDCENGYVYTGQGAATMTGEFPIFDYGANTIVKGEGISSLVITPHWRWV